MQQKAFNLLRGQNETMYPHVETYAMLGMHHSDEHVRRVLQTLSEELSSIFLTETKYLIAMNAIGSYMTNMRNSSHRSEMFAALVAAARSNNVSGVLRDDIAPKLQYDIKMELLGLLQKA
jgi:phosphatidylserine/phosphatidylglycerophosphate/cardiolipin synthase-like enzyme